MKSEQIAPDALAAPEHLALLGVHQPAECPQQAGLPRPIGPRDLQALARARGKAHALQNVPIPSPEVQILGFQRHFAVVAMARVRGWLATGARVSQIQWLSAIR